MAFTGESAAGIPSGRVQLPGVEFNQNYHPEISQYHRMSKVGKDHRGPTSCSDPSACGGSPRLHRTGFSPDGS